MKRILYVITILLSTINFGYDLTQRIDVGTGVWIKLDKSTKTFLVQGEGKIRNEKFREFILNIHKSGENKYNNENYTIRIKDNKVKFPNDSYYLFAANDEERRNNPILPVNVLVEIPADMDTSNVTRMRGMFAFLKNANPDVTNFDVSNVYDLSHMFKEMDKATPNTEKWVVTDKVEEIQWMFYHTKKANPVVTNWDTSNVHNMNGVFANAKIAAPDVSKWKTGKVKKMSWMFAHTENANPDMSNWDLSKVLEMQEMFNQAKGADLENILNWLPATNIAPSFITGTKVYEEQIEKINRSYLSRKDELIGYMNDGNIEMTKYVIRLKDTVLDNAIEKLTETINKAKQLPEKNLATDPTQNALTNKITEADNVVKKTKPKYNDIIEKQKELDKAILNISKEIAASKVDKLTKLSPEQKNVIKNKINAADTENKINQILDEAKKLNNKKDELEKKIKAAEKVKEDNKNLATPEVLSKLDDAIKETKKAKEKNNITETGLEKEIKKLDDKINDVLDEVKTLNETKENAKATIKGLKALNYDQKNKYIDKVNAEKDKSEITKIVNFAKELDDKKAELDTKIVNANMISAEDRKKATEESLKKLDEAVKKATSEKEKLDITKEELQQLIDNIKPLLEKVNEEIKAVNQLEEAKKQAKERMKKDHLTTVQMNKYFDEIDKATKISELQPIVDKVDALNDSIGILKDKLNEIDKLSSDNKDKILKQTLSEIDSKKYEALKAKDRIDVTKPEIDKYISELDILIKKAKRDIKLAPQRVKLEDYVSKADALYYDDITIADKVTEDIFVNVDLGLNMTNLVKKLKNNEDLSVAIAGLQFGGSGKINPDLRMGAFIEYANKKSHHAALGISLGNDNIKSFVRYRIALLDRETINHNLDLYFRYGHEFKFEDDFSVYVGGGVLGTYSSPTKLSEKVLLNQRFGIKGDIALRMNYIIDTLKIYLEPRMNFGYNDQMLSQINMKEHKLAIKRSYFEYGAAVGFNKEYENGVIIGNELRFNGDLYHKYTMNFTTKVAYKW